jgi:TIR domain
MTGIFLSYRRMDAQGWAGHLGASLAEAFGEAGRFFDISSIPPGSDFLKAIEDALKASSAVLVLIGPKWLEAANEDGTRRIDDAEDVVRLEIATAVAQSAPVIPVLLGGAKMPLNAQLPDSLSSLACRNAFELSDSRWAYDCDRLFESLSQQTGLTLLRGDPTDAAKIAVASGLEAVDSQFGAVTGLRGAHTGKIEVEVLRDATLKGVKTGDIVGVDASPGKVKP